MRALAPLAVVAVLATACGGKVVAPLPNTVVGTLPNVPKPVTGDATAGKALFTKNGCAACHTFKPAGSTGKVGPDLDNLAAYAQKAGQPLADFAKSAIVSPPAPYVPPGFTNSMPTTFGSTLSAKQIADLVAFLTQGH